MSLEKHQSVVALLQRSNLRDAGLAALRQAFPHAPAAMLDAAAFHLFVDGVPAAADWLAGLERFLRDPTDGINHGLTFHLLYHLYNWQQVQALLPAGREGALELLADVKRSLAEDDPEMANRTLERLEEMFLGGLRPPDFQ